MSETSVVQMLISGKNDLAWFESNLDYLHLRYDNKFIAFHNKKVIDFDELMDNTKYNMLNIGKEDFIVKKKIIRELLESS